MSLVGWSGKAVEAAKSALRSNNKVFLPNWYMKVVKPGIPVARNQAVFHVPKEMTKFDIRNYLASIYGLDVLAVNTVNVMGSLSRIHGRWLRFNKGYKKAYVTLGSEFSYPLAEPEAKARRPREEYQRTVPHTLIVPTLSANSRTLRNEPRLAARLRRKEGVQKLVDSLQLAGPTPAAQEALAKIQEETQQLARGRARQRADVKAAAAAVVAKQKETAAAVARARKALKEGSAMPKERVDTKSAFAKQLARGRIVDREQTEPAPAAANATAAAAPSGDVPPPPVA
ncbi:hypothetical protein CAOG_05027 [Capsaspora owczarzaki ATCC 30864]|uniref:Large ribosomal subunit protein uL23m n=1 Tax=Capsaspora owczarzaki (strain ATCC 30864) TaxID=595528 RepID=A0A0D2UGZ8_CAPO3|nr:hypothetical protein CAOG_05027 [Capsaspora owczarzaki ATCC 30864]KJE94381.1 hypothetical protein CAOG_005027 [Capsaspora owczarzaki ATCC 30864]|eukprot:XP_004346712.2 hypothetical protein CAOG_05027 [Capsaspora owczarzaki ATCC 30864]